MNLIARFFFLCALGLGFAAQAKPFRKALVIGGGGITPGISLGMIAGAKAAGYDPDVIIVSCGASLGASLYSAFPTPEQALKYARSEKFYQKIDQNLKMESWLVFGLLKKFNKVMAQPHMIPDLFQGNILKVNETVTGLLPQDQFPTSSKIPKLIILGSRASFGPQHVGHDQGKNPLYRQVFFTDPSTAQHLRGLPSPIQKLFPESRIDKKTETRSNVSMSMAVRSSITDPYYINPAKIGDSYYFGGAVDLFPIETAQEIADEVLVNFPSGLYSNYEDLTIYSTFGFPQSERTTLASHQEDVKWIDSSGSGKLAMDPIITAGVFMTDRYPKNHQAFSELVLKQYRFGYQRAVEAVQIQRGKKNVRTHLRYPFVGVK